MPNLGTSHHLEVMRHERSGIPLHGQRQLCLPHICQVPTYTPWSSEALWSSYLAQGYYTPSSEHFLPPETQNRSRPPPGFEPGSLSYNHSALAHSAISVSTLLALVTSKRERQNRKIFSFGLSHLVEYLSLIHI